MFTESFNTQMGLAIGSRPYSLSMYLVVLLCFAFGFPHAAASAIGRNETDRLALLAFKEEITGDPFGTLSSWNESVHFCQWEGVKCGHRHQGVTVLDLDSRELAGPISPHIGNLTFLRRLWLRHNRFSHIIPPELGRLRRLQFLSLRNNSISGEIPANISSCSSLLELEFSLNPLVGTIPVELGSLSKLHGLYIWRNNVTGPIPSTLGNLSSLQLLSFFENRISGSIPDVLDRLSKLEVLSFGDNRLVGTIPSSIFNNSSIQYFDVATNQLQGSLPSDLGITFPNLSFIDVDGNSFTGSIPFSITNASKLEYLYFGANQFAGKVPPLEKLHGLVWLGLTSNYLGAGAANDLDFLASLTNATALSVLAFNDNNFGGVFPEFISNFSTNLSILVVNSNKITGNIPTGNIPTGIGNLVNLERIEMWNNDFTGTIPSDIGKFRRLQHLSLSINKFSGNIPLSLGNLSLLIELYLAENSLYGNIPSDLGKCALLQVLSLYLNNLTGTISREVISLSSLLRLTLFGNHLSGSLPADVGNLRNVEVLDVSENMLSGKIPSTLGSCVKLRLLYVENNNFQGIIPSSLSSLRGMEELDLSRNNFSGKFPEFLGDFVFLQKLNVSFNDFEGMVPEKGIFKNATVISVQGNNRLCGGIPELHLRSCNSKGSTMKRSNLTIKLAIPITIGLIGGILIAYFLYRSWLRKSRKVPSFEILGSTFQKVSYQTLHKATGGFNEGNLIGVGGFGSVYKGILDQGGKVVAVKVLNLEFRGASKSFLAECKALKSMKHRNLVKALTACSSIDYHGNEFKALVYEFMVNGSLDEWLHPKMKEDKEDEDSRNLNLLQRLNIAIDVASALDYIHNHCPEPIIHCDLKPSNVLLDSEMIGHVGDFGLAKFFPEAILNSSACNGQSSSIGIRGSVGYVAPEYGMGNEVSTSGDVYSYGILLLEMFTGKGPTDDIFSYSLSLHNFVKMALPQQIEGIADPRLLEQSENVEASSSNLHTPYQSSTSGEKTLECLISILKLGIACSEELPSDRMAIGDVITQLTMIRNTYFGASGVHGGRRARIHRTHE